MTSHVSIFMFQDFLVEWLIDLWPVLHLVLVLQEVQDLLSLLWSHCIHLGLENQYLQLDPGDPDAQAHVISLTSDPLLAGRINPVRNILLGLLPCLENLEHQHFPEIRKSHKFFYHYTSSSGAEPEPEPNVFTRSPLCPAAPAWPTSPFWPFSPKGPGGPGKPGGPCGPCHPREPGGPFSQKRELDPDISKFDKFALIKPENSTAIMELNTCDQSRGARSL